MVHCFTYTHKGNPLYFVWDVESGSLHNVDEAAFLVSKKRYQQLSDDENERFLKLSESDLKEIDAELDLLEKDGDGISGKRTIGVYPVVFADILYVSTEHIGIKPLHIDPGIGICRHIGK